MLFDMLAPSDVKVVVSRENDAAVSIAATPREHEVLSSFLQLLHWTNGDRDVKPETRRRHEAKAHGDQKNTHAREKNTPKHAERKRTKGHQERARTQSRRNAAPGAKATVTPRFVYRVTGDHAVQLLNLLAPSSVKVVVSRAEKGIAVRGTKNEQAVLRNALQLLNWTKRGKAFEKMTRGERIARKYKLNEAHAAKLFDMLAPSDVKVVVSRASDDTLSIQATPAEHKVLVRFLKLLAWRAPAKSLKSANAIRARVAPPTPRRGKAAGDAPFVASDSVIAKTAPVPTPN